MLRCAFYALLAHGGSAPPEAREQLLAIYDSLAFDERPPANYSPVASRRRNAAYSPAFPTVTSVSPRLTTSVG